MKEYIVEASNEEEFSRELARIGPNEMEDLILDIQKIVSQIIKADKLNNSTT